MKRIKWLLFVFFTSNFLFAQSIIITAGASIEVGAGADICATGYGNITGTLIGDGTQCSQLPLPVELVSFNAKAVKNIVELTWKTDTEMNNFGFEIERKSSNNWLKIGFIEGNGNSNSPKEYKFIDSNPLGGSKFLYRLKQIDNDGQFEYSSEIEIQLVPDEYALYPNFPNPFNSATVIRYQLPKESKVEIKIYDILGSEVKEILNEQKEAGIYEVNFNADYLTSGTYIYRIIAGDFRQTKKMILLK
jgi:hypothetical protein